MQAKLGKPWPAAALTLALAGSAYASGFNLYEAGARGTALGGAFTATADDASAVFYNPAGLAFLSGTNIDVNWLPVIPKARFSGKDLPDSPARGETVTQSFSLPGLYLTHTTAQGLGYGAGIYTPFGLGVEWQDPRNWVGRQSSYDADLATVYFTPAVACRIGDRAAISAGLDIAYQRLELKRFTAQPFGGDVDLVNVIDTRLQATSEIDLTPCAGILAHVTDELSLGVMYHHQKSVSYAQGKATLTNVAPAALREAVSALIDNSLGGREHEFATTLKLPFLLSLGVAYRIHPAAQLEFDAVRVGWSHFDQLEIIVDGDSGHPLTTTIREEFTDIWQLRFGLDIDVARDCKAMFGYIHDNTPQPRSSMGPLLADAEREDFSCGLQYRHRNWRFTGTYMAVFFDARSTLERGQITYLAGADPDETAAQIQIRSREAGTYDSFAHIFGVGIGYGF